MALSLSLSTIQNVLVARIQTHCMNTIVCVCQTNINVSPLQIPQPNLWFKKKKKRSESGYCDPEILGIKKVQATVHLSDPPKKLLNKTTVKRSPFFPAYSLQHVGQDRLQQGINIRQKKRNKLKCKFSFYSDFILQQKLCKAFRRHFPHIRAIFKTLCMASATKYSFKNINNLVMLVHAHL